MNNCNIGGIDIQYNNEKIIIKYNRQFLVFMNYQDPEKAKLTRFRKELFKQSELNIDGIFYIANKHKIIASSTTRHIF